MKTQLLKGLIVSCLLLFVVNKINAQETSDNATYYYNNFETATAGTIASLGASGVGNANRGGSSTTIDAYTSAPLDGSTSLQSIKPSTNAIGNIRWDFVGAGAGTIDLTQNDWEWNFVYKNTSTSNNDDPDQMAVGNNAWRFWLFANSYNGNSTQGFYVSQVAGNLVLRYRNTTASGANKYNTILTTALPNNQTAYMIKIQRLKGGSWAIYMDPFTSGMTTASTLATSSTGTTGNGFSTYYYSFLETTCTATNRFEWDDFNMYTRSLQFTAVNSASNNIDQGPFYAGQTNVVLYGLQFNARGNFLVNQLVITGTGSQLNSYFSSATLYQSTNPVFSTSTSTSLGAIALTGSVAQTFSLNSSIASSGNTNGSLSTPAYYFIVANLSSTLNFGTTPYGSMNFGSVTTLMGNGNSTALPYTNGATTSNTFTFGQTIDWTGGTSTAWATASNWTPASVPGVNDAVRIGVKSQTINTKVGFDNQPTISDTRLCASLTMGTYKTITLTVTSPGNLTVSNAVTQNPSASSYTSNFSGTTTFAGTGSLTAGSLAIGDATTAPNTYGINNTLTLASTLNSLHITGDVSINSTNFGVFIFGLGYNNAGFSLLGGTTLIDGTILTANTSTGWWNTAFSTPKFSIDVPTGSALTPILQLTNANAINSSSVASSIDFYNNTGGTGTATVQYTGTNQTVYTDASPALGTNPQEYQYLTLSGSGTKTIGETSGGSLTVGQNLTTSATSVLFNTYNSDATIGNNWTNTSNVTQGSGDITVTAALTNNSGGTLNLGSGDLYIGGNYTNASGGVYTQGTGTTHFNGTGAQTLADNSSTGTAFKTVAFDGSGTATINSGTGNFNITSTGNLSMVSPAKLVAGSTSAAYLTLKSDTLGSASVGIIPSGSSITGFVTVQRFVQGNALFNVTTQKWQGRNYRLMSSQVNEGIDGNGKYPYSVNYLAASTIITACTSSFGTTTGNPSLYLYNEFYAPSNRTFTSGNFIGVTNINENTPSGTIVTTDGNSNEKIYTGEGFMLYFRGDKITHLTGAATKTKYPYVAPESVVFSATGNLNQGSYAVKSWTGYTGLLYTTSTNTLAVRGFNLVGNPYASSIDWKTYYNGGISVTNVYPTIYVFNPVTNQYNSYLASSASSGTGNPASTTSIIASGQGFFVQSSNSGSALTFNESAKSTTVPTGSSLLLGTPLAQNPNQLFRLRLSLDSVDYDDITIGFNSSASPKYSGWEDVQYLPGVNAMEGLASYSEDGIPLAINFLPLPKLTPQVIKLDVQAGQSGLYTFEKTALDAIPKIYEIWLMDHYKKDSLDIRNNSTYKFNVNLTDTNSFGKKRFSVVIRQAKLLNIHLLNFTATKASDGAEIVWKAENEQNYTNFTVERSSDGGVTFNVLGGFVSTVRGTYSFLDKTPPAAADQYRLKIEDLNGTITYSKIVTLIYGSGGTIATSGNISVFPNPANGVINLAINKPGSVSYSSNTSTLQKLGTTPGITAPQTKANVVYGIKIINITGSVVKTATSSQPTWQNNVGNLSPGTYIIEVVNNNDNSLVGKSTFVKL